jgi:hypothetical protein
MYSSPANALPIELMQAAVTCWSAAAEVLQTLPPARLIEWVKEELD